MAWHLDEDCTGATLEFEPTGGWSPLGPADGAPGAHIEIWSDRLADARADAAWVKQHQERDEIRTRVIVEIRQLIRTFLEGTTDLATLRSTFDQRTRNEWDVFGLKGMSGAMFLDTLVKHVPDQAEVTTRLRAALSVPDNDERARTQMQAFSDYLDGLLQLGGVSRKMVQPSRAPFFVSAARHVQAPDAWPVFYESSRQALESVGFLRPLSGQG